MFTGPNDYIPDWTERFPTDREEEEEDEYSDEQELSDEEDRYGLDR